jgi:hypothetical protein
MGERHGSAVRIVLLVVLALMLASGFAGWTWGVPVAAG